jgi:para-nitrobenzyl esterase
MATSDGRRGWVAALLVGAACVATGATASGVVATVEQQLTTGVVRGAITTEGVQRFLGVPFALPPVGDLRWQPTQPAANWTGVRDALNYSASCAQGSNTFDDFSGISEDCL